MEIRGTMTHLGLMVGSFTFPKFRLKLFLLGPLEFSWDKLDVPGPAIEPKGFWFWSPSRVWLFESTRSKSLSAVGVSIQLWESWSIAIHVGQFAVRLGWNPAHKDIGPRDTMRERRRIRKMAELLARMFGHQHGSDQLDSSLAEMAGLGGPDFRNRSNLN